MSRFHQRLRQHLQDPEFAEAFEEMGAEIALIQALEEAREALQITERELAERMGTQRPAITRLFNDANANPTLETITALLRALGLHAEIILRQAQPDEGPLEARFVPSEKAS
jgi:transcriptional regulator with XRE-family HTH domain